jgi:hypothetical protein
MHFDVKALSEHLPRGDEKPPLVGNDVADIIRQAAVSERNVRSPVEKHDVDRFVEPP